jgi:hypothetical protein
LLERMVARESVCLRRLAAGERSRIVQFDRLLGNAKVTVERLLEGWSERTGSAAAGRHVLAIQDTSEICFKTTAADRRGLGEIGKGGGRGVLLHAMLAVDAEGGGCLGLVGGAIWTRPGRVAVPHAERELAAKESRRWLGTAERAKAVLSAAAMVTVIADREGDIYAEWAWLPGPGFHLLTRAMSDRRLDGGGTLFQAAAGFAVAGRQSIELRARPGRPARRAGLELRFGRVRVRRPKNGIEPDLPDSIELTLVEVVEPEPPPGAEPVHWRLLTTHRVEDAAAAWRIVGWYRARWTIEQLFRVLKLQGLRLEDSQLESAARLLKLTAIATKAACITMQLVHARDGRSGEPAGLVFSPAEIAALDTLAQGYAGKTTLQTNPHRVHSLAWAAWIIARLGGWDGYPSSKPPGPITFKHGLQYFLAFAHGWSARDA